MDISTDSLRTFIAVCDCKSFSLAAEKVHKAQSAVSTQIAKLEERAGLRLIDRSQRPFRLTAEGKVFLDFAKEIVTKTEEIHRSLLEVRRGTRGEVRIGATRSVGTYILPEIISRITKECPSLKLLVLTQTRTSTYESLREGKIDLAIVLADTVPAGFVTEALRSEPLCFVISSEHPLSHKKHVSREELKEIPFIVGTEADGYSAMVYRVLEKNRILRPAVTLTISNLQGRKEAARAGLGVTIVPAFTVRDEIRNKALTRLTVSGVRLTGTFLMMVEGRRQPLNPSLAIVKKVIDEKLSSRSSNHSSSRLPDHRSQSSGISSRVSWRRASKGSHD